MAIAVVDAFEAIEVEVDDGQQALAPVRMSHGLAQPVGEQCPIGKAGQRVVMRDALKLLLVLLDLRDVREQPHILLHLAARVADRIDGEHLRVNVSALCAVPDLPRPIALAQQGFPHVLVEFLALQAGLKQPRILSQHLFARVSGNAGKGLIDIQNRSRAIGDHDAFAHAGEDVRGKAQPVLSHFSLGNVLGEQDDSAD